MTKDRVKQEYTDEEIQELADWYEELTIAQLFFLRDSMNDYWDFIKQHMETSYVH